MLRRSILVLVLLVCAGVTIWLNRDFRMVKAGSTITGHVRESGNSSIQTGDLSDEQPPDSNVPESSRHATDAISQHRQSSLAALDEAIRNQEAKVEAHRKMLANIVRTRGIVYKGTDSSNDQSGEDETHSSKNAVQAFHQGEQEKMQIESQLGSLQKYEGNQLMVYAAGLDLPDNVVRNLFPQYQQARRDLEALKINGVGEQHPTMISAFERIDALKRQLDEGITSLRATLKAQLDHANDGLKTTEDMKNAIREEAAKRAQDAQDYVNAKREYETDLQLLEEMRLKQFSAKAKDKTAR